MTSFSVIKFEGAETALHGEYSTLAKALAKLSLKGVLVQAYRGGILTASILPNPEATQLRIVVGKDVYLVRDSSPKSEPDESQLTSLLDGILKESLCEVSKKGEHNWFCYTYTQE